LSKLEERADEVIPGNENTVSSSKSVSSKKSVTPCEAGLNTVLSKLEEHADEILP